MLLPEAKHSINLEQAADMERCAHGCMGMLLDASIRKSPPKRLDTGPPPRTSYGKGQSTRDTAPVDVNNRANALLVLVLVVRRGCHYGAH